MRGRITWLVVGVASAIVLSFVIPLCLLVRTMTEERAIAATRSQAQGLAVLVAGIGDAHQLRDLLSQPTSGVVDGWVSLPDGSVISRAVAPEHHPESVARARTRAVAFSERTRDGIDVFVPVVTDKGVVVVHTSVLFARIARGVYAAWASIVALGVLLLALSVLVAGRMSRRISTPLVDLAGTAHRLRSGDLDARADVGGPAEITELGRALNQLADRIGDLLGAERERAADLSHRLRTPVTALRMDAEMVADETTRGRLLDHIQVLHRAVDSVVHDARRTSREAIVQPADAAALVRDRGRHWAPLAEDEGRELTVVAPAAALLVGLAEQDLADLVDNLVDKVFAHTPEGTPLRLSARAVASQAHGSGARGGSSGSLTPAGNSYVVICVEDGGRGLAESALIRRGVSGSGSTGLGLAIVERIGRGASGSVELDRSDLGGLRVSVRLPRSLDAPERTR
ncbi:MAG: HAMP domain-containing sensor histidine kinase [Dermatophilaceae bacterium]